MTGIFLGIYKRSEKNEREVWSVTLNHAIRSLFAPPKSPLVEACVGISLDYCTSEEENLGEGRGEQRAAME